MRPLFFVVFFFMPFFANASLVIDQNNIGLSTGSFHIVSDEFNISQTFTVGVDGILSEVAVYFDIDGTPSSDLKLEVQGVSGDLPDGNVYAETFVSPSSMISGLNTFDISSYGLSVNTNDIYTLVFSSPGNVGGGYRASRTSGNLYEAGKFVSHHPVWGILPSEDLDLIFQTKVKTVPIPAALWLFSSALLGLAGIRRYRQIDYLIIG